MPLGSVLGCWGAVVSPFLCNFGISVSSLCLRLISGGWLALLLGPLPSSCGPAFGLLCVGVVTAVLGFAVSFLVGTFTLILFGLLASSLRSFGTIFPSLGFWSCLVASFWHCLQCSAFLDEGQGLFWGSSVGLASCLCCGHCRCFFAPSRHTLLSLSGAACHALRKVGVLGSFRSGRLLVGMRFFLSLP